MGPNFPISRKLHKFKKFNSILYFFNSKNNIRILCQQKYLYSFFNHLFQNLIISKPIFHYKNNELNIKIFYFLDPNLILRNQSSKLFHKNSTQKKELEINWDSNFVYALKKKLSAKWGIESKGLIMNENLYNNNFIPILNSIMPKFKFNQYFKWTEQNLSLLKILNKSIIDYDNIEFLMNLKNIKKQNIKDITKEADKILFFKRKLSKRLNKSFIHELHAIFKLFSNGNLNLNINKIIECLIIYKKQKKIFLENKLKSLHTKGSNEFLNAKAQMWSSNKNLSHKSSLNKRKYFYHRRQIILNIERINFVLKFLENILNSQKILKTDLQNVGIPPYSANLEFSYLNTSSNSSKSMIKILENYLSLKLKINTKIDMVKLESPLLNSNILAQYFSLNLKKHNAFYIWKKLNQYIKIKNKMSESTMLKNRNFEASKNKENIKESSFVSCLQPSLFKFENNHILGIDHSTSDFLKKIFSNNKFIKKSFMSKSSHPLFLEKMKFASMVFNEPSAAHLPIKNLERFENNSSFLHNLKKLFLIKLWMKNFFTQQISGIKIKISGRFNKRKGATRTQVKYFSKGSFRFNSIDSFIDYGYFERKDRNGTQTIKVFIAN